MPTIRSSCGLVCAISLAAVAPAVAQAATEPQKFDLTMDKALALARTGSPAIVAAKAHIREARARVVGASVALPANPTLELGGGPRVGPAGTRPELDVGIEQVFELGGQRKARIDAANAGVAHASATTDDVARRALSEVAEAFLQARYLAERLSIAERSAQLAVEVLDVAKRRRDAGDVGVLDVNLATLALARCRAGVQNVEASQARALGKLRLLLGLPPGASVTVRGPLHDRRRHSLDSLLTRISERADLRALTAAIRQSEARARLGEARSWPDLGVRLGYAREEQADVAMVAFTLTLPFFDRGQGLEATARARGAALRTKRGVSETAVRSAVRTAFDVYRRLLGAVDEFERRGVPGIRENERLARRAYEEGAMKLGELLAVRRELVEARITHANLLLNAALARVELESTAGVLR